MLPVLVTVVFAPHGLTVGDVLADTSVRAAWAALRADRPSESVRSEQWQLDHDAAVRLLETGCDPREPVTLHFALRSASGDGSNGRDPAQYTQSVQSGSSEQ